MDTVQTVSTVSHPVAAASADTSAATKTAKSTSPKAAKETFAQRLADAQKTLGKDETLTRVAGHDYARISGGKQDDLCVNLSGNARNGETFDVVWRHGKCFHVYQGSGKEHTVVEVGAKKPTDAAAATGGTAAKTPAKKS